MKITLFYRDAGNYKYTVVFDVPSETIAEARAKLGEKFDDQEEPHVQYDVDLGISREEFHRAIESPYLPSQDHNLVIVESIE